jgi:serine/threonine-protein kinase RsbT
MTTSRGPETLPVGSSEQVVSVRQAVRRWAVEMGFSLVEQTKIVTAASELARNTLQHGGGGAATIEIVTNGVKRGLQLTFVDGGPGIPNIDLALQEGYTTAGGLGLGLPGARRLSHDFRIESSPGNGTTVVITRWK